MKRSPVFACYRAAVLFLVGALFLASCTSMRESGDGVKEVKLDDPGAIDAGGSYVFGRFGGTHTSRLGLYLTNTGTSEDFFIEIPSGRNRSGGVSLYSLRSGSYRITAFFIGDKKRPVNDPIYGEFDVESGKATYIGDWEGSVDGKGTTVYIRPTSEYAKTKADLVGLNPKAGRLRFIKGY